MIDEAIERGRRANPAAALRVAHGREILECLRKHGPMTQQDLLSHVPLGTPGNATRVLTRLVDCGVLRREKIGRRNELAITRAGDGLVDPFESVVARQVERFEQQAAQLRVTIQDDLPFANIVGDIQMVGTALHEQASVLATVASDRWEPVGRGARDFNERVYPRFEVCAQSDDLVILEREVLKTSESMRQAFERVRAA